MDSRLVGVQNLDSELLYRGYDAKCYLNEELCIITSLNLYEFSQINNNEMGVLLRRSDDAELYKDAYEEAQRIIRISDEVRISLERVSNDEEIKSKPKEPSRKITSSKLAQKLGMKTSELLEKLTESKDLEDREGKHYLTVKGKERGGEFHMGAKFGAYFLWPESFNLLP